MKRQPGPSQRQLRVAEEIRHVLAALLERGDFHDPEMAKRRVTVTEVKVGPDLRVATVYVTPLGGGDARPAILGLAKAAPWLRSEIGRAVRLRLVPELRFLADETLDEAMRIARILNSPEVKRDLEPPAKGEPEE